MGQEVECKYVSGKHIMSKLRRDVYAFKRETFDKLWTEILFKFQWHAEQFSQEFNLGPGLSFMFPLKLLCNLQSHIDINSLEAEKSTKYGNCKYK